VAAATAQRQLGRQEDEAIGSGRLGDLLRCGTLPVQLLQQRETRAPLILVEAVEQTRILPGVVRGDEFAGPIVRGQQCPAPWTAAAASNRGTPSVCGAVARMRWRAWAASSPQASSSASTPATCGAAKDVPCSAL
jgi:hypothetical protein